MDDDDERSMHFFFVHLNKITGDNKIKIPKIRQKENSG